MVDLLDLFAEPEPAPPAANLKPAAPQRAPLAAESPCARPWSPGDHKCRVGDGFAQYSEDHGRTWVCRAHAPADFLPMKRENAA